MIIVFWLFALPQDIFACSVMWPLGEPSQIFLGTLQSVIQSSASSRTITFTVQKVRKGTLWATTTVVTQYDDTSCWAYPDIVTWAQYIVKDSILSAVQWAMIWPNSSLVQQEITRLDGEYFNPTLVNQFRGQCKVLSTFPLNSLYSNIRNVLFSPSWLKFAFVTDYMWNTPYVVDNGTKIYKVFSGYSQISLASAYMRYSGENLYFLNTSSTGLYYIYRNWVQTNDFYPQSTTYPSIDSFSISQDRTTFTRIIHAPIGNNPMSWQQLITRNKWVQELSKYASSLLVSLILSPDIAHFVLAGQKPRIAQSDYSYINLDGKESGPRTSVLALGFNMTSTQLTSMIKRGTTLYQVQCPVASAPTCTPVFAAYCANNNQTKTYDLCQPRPSDFAYTGQCTQPQACTLNYQPVCGAKQVQCITTPCDPVPQTYGNRCQLEADHAIYLYEWECQSTNQQFNDTLPGVIAWLFNHGLTRYSNEVSFIPNNPLLREQAAKFFVQYALQFYPRAYDYSRNCSFLDYYSTDPTLKEYVIKSCQLGLFQGANGYFMPKQSLTNGQALAVLLRMVQGRANEYQTPRYLPYWTDAFSRGRLNDLYISNIANGDLPALRGELWTVLYRARAGR